MVRSKDKRALQDVIADESVDSCDWVGDAGSGHYGESKVPALRSNPRTGSKRRAEPPYRLWTSSRTGDLLYSSACF